MTTIAVRAQQAPPANLIPLTAASLAAHPDRYLDQTVAVHATVESTLSATAFLLDQDPTRTQPNDILVIAPSLTAHAKPGEYITVVGQVMRFDPADLVTKADGYTLDLPADVVARYRGRPMVLATSVLNSAMTDLALVVPPPPSPEEIAFDAIMKQVNPTFGELRKGLEAADPAVVTTEGTKLQGLFKETRSFFAKRSTADAQGWAGEAITILDAVTKGASGNDWAAAREAASQIQPLCAQCHGEHRERAPDGTYRVKRVP
jgi:hypothetical protein